MTIDFHQNNNDEVNALPSASTLELRHNFIRTIDREKCVEEPIEWTIEEGFIAANGIVDGS